MLELDEALARFQQCASEYGAGFANHGPMAAEAICRLGHPALLTGLVDLYAPRLPPCGEGRPIPEGERAAVLGDGTRVDDWRATFQAELAGGEWREVLRAALPDLVDGSFAGATHGLLRTAHAVRALAEVETPLRVAELAWGLAVWSAGWQALPGKPGARAVAGRGAGETLAAIEPLDPAPDDELLADAARALDDDPSFAAAIEGFDADAVSPDDAVSELCRAAAGLYLDHPHARVAYAHAVTAGTALRTLSPYLEDDVRRRALGRAVQAVAAIHAVSSSPSRRAGGEGPSWLPPTPPEEVERVADSPAEIRYRAACSLEVRAIELACACLDEDAIAPDPILRRAAADAALCISEGNRGRVT